MVDLEPTVVDEVKGEWLKCNFDTGAADTALPLEFAKYSIGESNDNVYRTASGELVPDQGQAKVFTENGIELIALPMVTVGEKTTNKNREIGSRHKTITADGYASFARVVGTDKVGWFLV